MKNCIYLLFVLLLLGCDNELKIPSRDYCAEIEVANGEDGRITYYSSQYDAVNFQRTTRKSWPDSIYIFLNTHSSDDFFGKGIDLKFDDGSKVKIDSVYVLSSKDHVNGGYKNRSFFLLDSTLVEKFSNHSLTEYTLYINHVKVDSIVKYKNYFNCIKDK